MKICIDAGHGNRTGAVNGKHQEDVYALDIAKRVQSKLKEKGHIVIMTRSTDQAMTLQQRCNVANNAKCDFFVSIHLNAATNKNASGIETWKYPKTSHKLAKNIQDALVRHFPDEKNRGVKEEKFYVLRNTNMPAALVECGFISHNPTAEKFATPEYRDHIAVAICEGICKSQP